MPTLDIETNVVEPRFARRVAKAVTLWAVRQGVAPRHVLVKFHAMADSQIFSAGVPFDRWPGQPGARHFACVTCLLDPDRSREFRRALAGRLAAAMQPEVPPEGLIVTFRPLRRDDVLLGSDLADALGQAS